MPSAGGPDSLRWIAAPAALVAAALSVVCVWADAADPGRLAVELTLVWLGVSIPAALGIRVVADASRRLESARHASLEQIAQLDIQNALLKQVAGAADVTTTLQGLATRVRELLPCDRISVALPRSDGEGFQTFTGRVVEEERRTRARVEVEFPSQGTLLARVIASGESVVIPDLAALAPDHIDVNFLGGSGFRSAVIVPLAARDRPFGALYALSRQPAAFSEDDVRSLRPIAEILGLVFVAQQLRSALTRLHTTEAMANLTITTATEINGALQTIVGQCDLLERNQTDPRLQRDLAVVVRQAQRIADLLDVMRATARERLREVTHRVNEIGITTGQPPDDSRSP